MIAFFSATNNIRLDDADFAVSHETRGTDPFPASSTYNPVELRQIELLLIQCYTLALQKASDVSFYDYPLSARLAKATTDYRRRLAVLESLSKLPPTVVNQVVLEWMKQSKPFTFDIGLFGEASWTTLAQYDISDSIALGRCSPKETTEVKITGLQTRLDGWGCKENKDDKTVASEGDVNFYDFYTASWFEGCYAYNFEIDSRLLGGYRQGQFLGQADEDETATIRYAVDGTAQIPQCTNVAVCNSTVTLLLSDLSQVGDKFTLDPSTSQLVTYKAVNQAAPVTLPVSTAIVVDRSQGPVLLTFSAKRNDQHIGVKDSKDWVRQHLHVQACAPPS